VDILESLNVPAYKVSSGDLNNYPFLSHIGKKGKPMILSTGMAEVDEIEMALESIRGVQNTDIILLQCTSAYPAPFDEVNLNSMKALGELSHVPVGFSDHTTGIEISIAAVALGACVIEKHFTLDKSMEGPDHKASLNPAELASLVSSIRNVEVSLGSSEKTISPSEEETKRVVRKKIVAATDLPAGTVLTRDDIALKRAEGGLDPSHLEKIISKKTKNPVKKNGLILLEHLED
jgi:sialic acid synthase SpsE